VVLGEWGSFGDLFFIFSAMEFSDDKSPRNESPRPIYYLFGGRFRRVSVRVFPTSIRFSRELIKK
jgi:hypothetical protein